MGKKTVLKGGIYSFFSFGWLFIILAVFMGFLATGCGPDPFFVPVMSINDVPDTGTAGIPLVIRGTVNPGFASYRTIVWSVNDAGNTGAVLSGNTLITESGGFVSIRAKVAHGGVEERDYTEDFFVAIINPVPVYTVSFETNGGTALDTQSVPEGQMAQRPADPLKPNFGFVDWYDNAGLNEPPYNFDTPVTGDLTLYAKWGDPCTVTFMDGDSVFDTKIVGEGGRVSRPADPVKSGYVFGNWYCDVELTILYDFDTPVSGDLILYARWLEPGTVTITLTMEAITEGTAGEALPASISISRGAVPAAVTVPIAVTGTYTSIKWEIDGVGVYGGQTVTGSGNAFTLDGTKTAYNTIGGHVLRLTVVKDGKTYMVNIPFAVIN